MKRIIPLLLFAGLVSSALASSPNSSGITTGSVNVSVTVMESSHIEQPQVLSAAINGEQVKKLDSNDPESGRIAIPAQPHSEMIVSLSGEHSLSDGNGGNIQFVPQARIGMESGKVQNLLVNGSGTTIEITGSNNGGYRGIATLQLFGTLEAGEHNTGHFSTVYTVTAEYY